MDNLIMHDEDLMHTIVEEYFAMMKEEKKHPTVPGLALAICFTRTHDIVQVLKKWEAGENPYPEESIDKLLSSITRIEDHYLQQGLSSRIPAALTKFCLGAYHKVQEPTRNEAPTGGNNMLQIVFEAGEDQKRFPTVQNVNQLAAPSSTRQDNELQVEFSEVM